MHLRAGQAPLSPSPPPARPAYVTSSCSCVCVCLCVLPPVYVLFGSLSLERSAVSGRHRGLEELAVTHDPPYQYYYTTLSTQSSPPPSSSQEPGEGGGGGFLSCSCRMERETKDQLGPRWCPVMRISQRRSGGDAMWYPLSFTNQGDCLHSLPKCKCICEHNFTKRDLIVSEVISLWN